MVAEIYETLRAIIILDFPKNNQGQPAIGSAVVKDWLFGDRQIINQPAGVVIQNASTTEKDLEYQNIRQIDYTFKISFYASGDDVESSEKTAMRGANVIRSILNNHRSLWVCNDCPFTNKVPLSPIHYINNGTLISSASVTTANFSPSSLIISVPATGVGYTSPAYIKISKTESGKPVKTEILSSGIGINTNQYTDANVSLSLTLTTDSSLGLASGVTFSYIPLVIDKINSFWAETHSTPSPPYYDWAGVSYEVIRLIQDDWNNGAKNSIIQNNVNWNQNFNYLQSNYIPLVRFLQNLEVSSVNLESSESSTALLRIASFTLKATEIVKGDEFGPNNVTLNSVKR